MENNRLTQKKLAFYKLYKEQLKNPQAFIEAWRFTGEILIEETESWGFMSYKCPTRLTDIFQENPGMLDREFTTGKSGAKFYQYRMIDLSKLVDSTLSSFLSSLSQGTS